MAPVGQTQSMESLDVTRGPGALVGFGSRELWLWAVSLCHHGDK